ncbi:MAG: hypothetical protein AB8B86_14110 [Pseudomonadales bacterium]
MSNENPSYMRQTCLAALVTLLGCEGGGARVQLTTKEILTVFSNVNDSALIQDAAGTTAQNIWFADGRFENRWSNAKQSGIVLGTWSAENDKRCVSIVSGLPDLIGKKKCGPIYRQGTHYVSINADGSVHAFHTLTPLSVSLDGAPSS